MNLAERYESFRYFKRETGMESRLIAYQDWTAELQHLQSCTKNEILLAEIDFDIAFEMCWDWA